MNNKTLHLRVLIVDDMLVARELLAHLLDRLGVQTIAQVADGGKALSKVAQERFDIVFLDIEMPGQTGLDVLRQLAALPQPPWVVIVSAHSTMHNIQAAVDAGAKGFVVKPYTIGKIQQHIDGFLQASGHAPK